MLDPVIPPALHPATILRRFWLPLLLAVSALGCGAWWLVTRAFNDRGYAPPQPIAFSHKLHAGDLGIDCRYCHSGVERGKHATIPAMTTCMGCHSQVKTDSPEIQKLAAIAAAGSYIADAKDGSIVKDPATHVGATVIKEGGAVHWNRVHKLPDHVYFNHARHVAAGVDCASCHGPVKEMVRLRQHVNMSMAWCLDCHRGTDYVSRIPASATPGLAAADAFAVGTADYATVRARSANERGPVVVFPERGQPHALPATAPMPAGGLTPELHRRLEALLGAMPEYRQLPPGKVMDLPPHLLPESHRAFYVRPGDGRPHGDPGSYHNAPTQCSTCHQ